MNVVVWIVQALLALAFLAAGSMKLSQPREKLATTMGWVEGHSDTFVRALGAVEVLAAIGLVLPAATGIATPLTPLAAVGLVLLMIAAAVTHARREENQQIAMNAVLLVLAAVVVWARFGPYSF